MQYSSEVCGCDLTSDGNNGVDAVVEVFCFVFYTPLDRAAKFVYAKALIFKV